MRNLIVKKYGFDEKPPTDYIIYNRGVQFRNISNFDDVTKAISFKYPKYNWKNIKIEGGLINQWKIFNNIKIFIAMHGAAFSNTLFMQPNTAVVEMQVERWVDNYLWLSYYTKVHHIFGRNLNIKWRDSGINNLNVTEMVEMVGLALKSINEI